MSTDRLRTNEAEGYALTLHEYVNSLRWALERSQQPLEVIEFEARPRGVKQSPANLFKRALCTLKICLAGNAHVGVRVGSVFKRAALERVGVAIVPALVGLRAAARAFACLIAFPHHVAHHLLSAATQIIERATLLSQSITRVALAELLFRAAHVAACLAKLPVAFAAALTKLVEQLLEALTQLALSLLKLAHLVAAFAALTTFAAFARLALLALLPLLAALPLLTALTLLLASLLLVAALLLAALALAEGLIHQALLLAHHVAELIQHILLVSAFLAHLGLAVAQCVHHVAQLVQHIARSLPRA
jgi:hypothetical protein